VPEVPIAVVAGHLCLDVLPEILASSPEEFRDSFGPGRIMFVGPVALSTGGAVSNTGIALHKLGIPVRLIAKVGADMFGGVVKQVLSSFDEKLADWLTVDSQVSTSYTVVINPPGIDRYLLNCPGTNDTFRSDDVCFDGLEGVRLFHFGYPSIMRQMYADDGAQTVELFRRARDTGATTSLDMAYPDLNSPAGRVNWPGILPNLLPYVDVFLPSIEEILAMLRRDTLLALRAQASDGDILPLITPQLLSDVSQQLLGLGVKVVVLKLGYRGLYVRTAGRAAIEAMGRAAPSDPAGWADQELWIACFKVNLVGAAGAGDSTIAGFLSGLLRDMSLVEATTAAVAVGACNVEAADTLSGVRSWDDTLNRVAAGWPRHDLRVAAPGWRFDAQAGLWRGRQG
jgi:sugar/nucleoside kinase (ribokinase family)